MTTPVSLKDLALSDQKRSSRVEALRNAYFDAVPEICCERPSLVTRYARKHGLFAKPTISVLTGGMEIQFNVTTHDTFVDAVKHPQKYPELLVRVSGYTAYFKDLNPQMQQEIIERTEYNLATGQAVQFSRTR
jgi:autonomous glycyl radical cofactor GrcA